MPLPLPEKPTEMAFLNALWFEKNWRGCQRDEQTQKCPEVWWLKENPQTLHPSCSAQLLDSVSFHRCWANCVGLGNFWKLHHASACSERKDLTSHSAQMQWQHWGMWQGVWKGGTSLNSCWCCWFIYFVARRVECLCHSFTCIHAVRLPSWYLLLWVTPLCARWEMQKLWLLWRSVRFRVGNQANSGDQTSSGQGKWAGQGICRFVFQIELSSQSPPFRWN